MESIVGFISIGLSTLFTAIAATWVIAQKTGIRRADLNQIVTDVTNRMDKLIEKIDKIAQDSVKRAEFQEEIHILRNKVTKHIENHNIHVGHNS
jgi:hypothetical protein